MCNNCVKYDHKKSDFWNNGNKDKGGHFNGEFHNYRKEGHREVDFWEK